jgi:hypothetical protein
MALIKEEEFQTAVRFAKALARRAKSTELTIRYVLAGALAAYEAGKISTDVSFLRKQGPGIRDFLAGHGVILDAGLRPVATEPMPMDADLKSLVVEQKNASLPVFLQAILEYEGLSDTVAEVSAEEQALLSDETMIALHSWATAVASKLNLKELSADVFAVAALLAADRGLVASRPSLLRHLKLNRAALEALSVEHKWDNLRDCAPSSADKSKAFSATFRQKIRKAAQSANPLLALVNEGIGRGASIKLKERIAYHESGHVIVSLLLRPKLAISEVSIIEKDDADGHVSFDETSAYHVYPTSREDFQDTLCVSLAGRIAEQKKFGHDAVDAGATSDLADASRTAWQAITEWGLDEEFGPVHLSALPASLQGSGGWLFDQAQQRLQRVLKEAGSRTVILIETHWHRVEMLATALLDKKTLNEDAILAICPIEQGESA